MAFVTAQLQGFAEDRKQIARDALDVIALGGLLENDDEFVATEPRHDIARPQRAAQPARDFHQQHIAGVMPQRIVDDLEAVEIDEQHGELPLVAPRRLDRVAQQPVEHFPIGQLGQAVVRGKVFDPLVGPGLLVGAVEIVERERDVFGQPREQLHHVVGENVFLRGEEQQHARGLAVPLQERKAGA